MLKAHDLSKTPHKDQKEDNETSVMATDMGLAEPYLLSRSQTVVQEVQAMNTPWHVSQSPDESHVVSDTSAKNSSQENNGLEAIPHYILEIITGLQREVLLSRNDLDLELWMKRENIRHIERLYQDNVTSKSAEVERQGLVSPTRFRFVL